MGTFIVCSFEALLFLEKSLKEPPLSTFPSARFKIFVDGRMTTISPFSEWGKGMLLRTTTVLPGDGRENFLLHARAVEVSRYFSS